MTILRRTAASHRLPSIGSDVIPSEALRINIMQKKLQVFVSSTYNDLKAERQAAVQAILLAEHIPAGMELFAAGDKSQWETICQWIDDSDVYMLILGGRYGTIDPESGKSYTEKEYRYAMSKGKPLFSVVASEDIIRKKVEAEGPDAIETMRGDLLKEFRKLVTEKICRFFSTVDALRLAIVEALRQVERNDELVGWVRGDEVIDAKATLERMQRLQIENDKMRTQLERLSSTDPTESLNEDAKLLLVVAAKKERAIIIDRNGPLGCVVIGRTAISKEKGMKSKARWEHAVMALVHARLAERNSIGNTYRLTHLGYETAETICRKEEKYESIANQASESDGDEI